MKAKQHYQTFGSETKTQFKNIFFKSFVSGLLGYIVGFGLAVCSEESLTVLGDLLQLGDVFSTY